MRRYSLIVTLGTAIAFLGCGDSGKSDKDTTTQPDSTGDVSGDTSGDADIVLPSGCYLPAAPTAVMDCDLMCRKVTACGLEDDDCLSACTYYTFLLAPDAGPKVEDCFVESPCNDYPAALGAIGCLALLADDTGYTPPAGNAAACTSILAKADTCGLASALKDQIGFLCDKAGPALSADIMGRAAACASESCVDFTSCLDGSSCIWDDLLEDDEIPVETDSCLDERDTNAIGTRAIVSEALACVDGCGDGTLTCAQSCIVDGSNLTGSCSTCFALLGRCIRRDCAADCSDPSSAACFACQTSAGCAADFKTCAGIAVPGSPEDALDCTEADQGEIGGEDMVENVTKCVGQCDDGATCNDECMAAVLFVSQRCSDCAGELAVCAGAACPDACDDLDFVPECYRCLAATECLAGFESCSGVAIGAPEHALCLGPDDVAKAEDGSAWSATAACWASCTAGDEGCVATCIAGLDLSATCRPCYADFSDCTDSCSSVCAATPASPECAACIAPTSCTASFETCAGVAPYVPPALGTADCDSAFECALACSGSGAAACIETCIQKAQASLIPLVRRVTECIRETCNGKDVSCLATECLADYQACYAITPTLACDDLGACLGACATSECQGDCFTRTLTVDHVRQLMSLNDCVGRFCGGEPSGNCVDIVVNDRALCGVPAALCQDPTFEPLPITCREVAACVSLCQTQDCADACLPDALPTGVGPKVDAFFQCFAAECADADNASLCLVTNCWDAYSACYGEPGFALTCTQIDECQAQCDYYSCTLACIGTAADSATATTHEALLDCVYDHCTGPDGLLLEGCPEAVMNGDGACNALASACYE